MLSEIELSGLAGLIALALPLLALVTLLFLAVRQIRRRRQRAHAPTARDTSGAADGPPRETTAEAPSLPTGPSPAPATTPDHRPEADTPPAAGEALARTGPTAAEIAAEVAAAEGAGAEAQLGALYLALAGARIRESGPGPECAEILLKCIRLAARRGDRQLHAEARIALGDVLREQGDLTSACEHWQIARGLFHDLKIAGMLAGAEQRMRQNGCPTDWVLNDF